VARAEGKPRFAFFEDQDGERPAENVEGLDTSGVREDKKKGEPGLNVTD
jgi:hypothetical protein